MILMDDKEDKPQYNTERWTEPKITTDELRRSESEFTIVKGKHLSNHYHFPQNLYIIKIEETGENRLWWCSKRIPEKLKIGSTYRVGPVLGVHNHYKTGVYQVHLVNGQWKRKRLV